ncbi:TVP38/TMEM64 family protein [Haloarcula sp. JP-L23]|uniref:TVP38/TMEM64 family protein n=1 Tax=Haloarcula sp. JP-L23 TaxID=2716717 RepID=UPI00140F1E20|nr:TVP38/TMEM64 family protein [Haloarcula sp. JP-L23]
MVDSDDTDDGRVFASAVARRDAIVRTLVLVGALVAVTVALRLAVPGLTDPEWVRARIATFGVLAPLVFLALQTAQVVLAPVPGQVLASVGGYLFGTLRGTGYSMTGVVLGSTLVFVAARRFGRPYVERVVDPATLDRWDEFVARTGVPGLFVLFLLPTFPDDVLCFVAGLTDIRLRTFLTLVVVGRTPSFLAVAYAGTQFADGALGTAALVLTLLTAGSVVAYAVRHRIVAGLERVT